jgi:acetylornithine deacetylase/succinyl-diaminopimelate desuccinylase-like protein
VDIRKNWLKDAYAHIDKNFPDIHLPRIVSLVQQPSICGTGEGIEECSDMVMELLTGIGCVDVHKEYYVHSPVVVGKLNADVKNAPSMIMYGMYDVQPPEPLEEWTVPPYGGTIKEYSPYGECVVSRGIKNSKGPLVCFINAVDSIKKTLGYMPVNVLFVVEGEEEMGSESLIPFTKAHAEELSKYDVTFLNGLRQDEQGKPYCIFGNKGILYMDIEVTGGNFGGPQKVDVHGMNAAWLSSPVWYLVNALASMRDKDDNILIEGFFDDVIELSESDEALTQRMIDVFDERMYLEDRLTAQKFMKNYQGAEAVRNLIWKPTLNIDGIWAGYTGPATKTVLPYKACAKMDVRLVPPMTAETVLNRIQKHLRKNGFDEVRIKVRQGTPGSKIDTSCLAARAALRAMEESGIEGSYAWPIYPGTGPSYLFTQPPLGVPFVSYGLGQGGRIHAPDEWATVQGLHDNEKSCTAYIYYMVSLAQEERQI